jgi:hypothetical protein
MVYGCGGSGETRHENSRTPLLEGSALQFIGFNKRSALHRTVASLSPFGYPPSGAMRAALHPISYKAQAPTPSATTFNIKFRKYLILLKVIQSPSRIAASQK